MLAAVFLLQFSEFEIEGLGFSGQDLAKRNHPIVRLQLTKCYRMNAPAHGLSSWIVLAQTIPAMLLLSGNPQNQS
jgi:hypothetical protein